jgi:hypothetical protein
MGIGISMNKFNPIVYSEEFLESELYKKNKTAYDRAIVLQKQKFAPLMTDKKITRIIYKEGDESVQDRFNEEFNSQIGLSEVKPFNYFFSVAFSNVKTVYDYSNDENISNNNIIEFYALVHSFDEKSKNEKKAAGVPIEMFKVIAPEPSTYKTNPETIPKTEESKPKKSKTKAPKTEESKTEAPKTEVVEVDESVPDLETHVLSGEELDDAIKDYKQFKRARSKDIKTSLMDAFQEKYGMDIDSFFKTHESDIKNK